MADSLLTLPVREIGRLYARKKLSPVDVTKACLKQTAKLNPLLNAFCHLDDASALRQARAAETRWFKKNAKSQIDGIPTTIKDWFHVKGWPTRQGSLLTSSKPQKEDTLHCGEACRGALPQSH